MSNQAYLTSRNESLKDQQVKTLTDYHIELQGPNLNNCNEIQDWIAAKVEIDNLLQNSKSASELFKKSDEVSAYWKSVRGQRRRTR